MGIRFSLREYMGNLFRSFWTSSSPHQQIITFNQVKQPILFKKPNIYNNWISIFNRTTTCEGLTTATSRFQYETTCRTTKTSAVVRTRFQCTTSLNYSTLYSLNNYILKFLIQFIKYINLRITIQFLFF